MRKLTLRSRISILICLPFLVTSLNSCSTLFKKTPSEIPPWTPKEGIETIAILGTNDIHGALATETEKTRPAENSADSSDSSPIEYQRGGAATLASYVKILQNEFGPRLLWLDGGDEFQGSVESNMQKGKGMVSFFNLAGLSGAAIGNHEFDFGPEESSDRLGAIKARMTEARYPYLAANIIDKTTGKLASFPNTYPSKIYSTGKVQIGVIGLSTLDTPKTTLPINIESLDFENLKEATLREAKKLRDQGADIVVITSHVGLKCDPGKMPTSIMIRRETDPQGPCDSDSELVKLIQNLPHRTVDAVVAAHTHQIVHHWVEGIPVIEGGAYGRYFNLIYLNYDLKNKKLLTEQTQIEGPVPVCPRIFSNQNDCNGDRPAPKEGRGSLVRPVFHGHKIKPDSQVKALIEPILDQASKFKNQLIAESDKPIDHERYKESPLGNLVADAIRSSSGADVALVNAGGIRAPLQGGKINYGQVFRSLPFDNSITVVKVTGKELRQIIEIAESGSRGFCPVSGVELKIIDLKYDAPSSDLNSDGNIEPWEVNRILEMRLANGEAIHDHKMYRLATIDFLVSGGDDVGWALKKIPHDRVISTGTLIRDATLHYIQTLASNEGGVITTTTHPLVDPQHPRFIFEKPKTSHSKGHHRRKKRRGVHI